MIQKGPQGFETYVMDLRTKGTWKSVSSQRLFFASFSGSTGHCSRKVFSFFCFVDKFHYSPSTPGRVERDWPCISSLVIRMARQFSTRTLASIFQTVETRFCNLHYGYVVTMMYLIIDGTILHRTPRYATVPFENTFKVKPARCEAKRPLKKKWNGSGITFQFLFN